MRIISLENKQDVDTEKTGTQADISANTCKTHRCFRLNYYATEFAFASGDVSMTNIGNQFEMK